MTFISSHSEGDAESRSEILPIVDPDEGTTSAQLGARYRWVVPSLQVGALIGLVVANVTWIHHYRFNLPFGIDEAGYLQRAIAFQQSLSHLSISGVLHQWLQPDIVAPLLPFLGGLLSVLVHVTPWTLLDAQQIFYVVLVVSTYALARSLVDRGWASLIAGVVACAPGVLVSSHFYLLGEPCTAMFTATLAAQVRVRRFDRRWPSIGWGVLLGLTTLTRTMVLGLLPALVIPAAAVVLLLAHNRRQIVHFLMGASIAIVIAASWYTTSGGVVYHYLTKFGYGTQADLFTGGQTQPVSHRWLLRIHNLIDQDLYFPLAAALVVCLTIAAVGLLLHRYRSGRSATRATWDGGFRAWLLRRARTVAGSPYGTVVIALLIGFLALATTSNSGTYFELVLVPVAVVAILVPARSSSVISTSVAAIACLGASAITAVDQFGLAPELANAASISIAGHSYVVFNDAQSDFVGPKLKELNLGGVWWSNCGGATVSCFYGRTNGITDSYLTGWSNYNEELVNFLYSYGPQHGYLPVVFFAYQGPLLNTNSVALTAQLQHRDLPIGVLMPSSLRDNISWKDQLDNPLYGQPNFVVAGATSTSVDGTESNLADRKRIASLLSHDGFRLVYRIRIPNASAINVWWKDR